MKTFLFTLLLFKGAACTDADKVFVCDSPNARKYHLQANCRGLSDCSHRIVPISLDSAKGANKTLCGWERSSAIR